MHNPKREIQLEEAVDLIYQIVRQRFARDKPSPFFFIVGAGISAPTIKLSREIEEECREEAAQYGNTAPPESNSHLDTYSHWLSKAHPSSEGLRDYLRDMMEGRPITKANLRLAHLLQGRAAVASTVFTPNFDDMLSQALSLFGKTHLVCDHPLTAGRMTVDPDDIQVVHVHGSYWFYDCCNLKGEIQERSKSTPMLALLDRWLFEHSPLVVGYAGWEGDVIMTALKRRLDSGRLGTPLFWFCHSHKALAELPRWLTESSDSDNIYFVVPQDSPQNVLGEAARTVGGIFQTPLPQSAQPNADDAPSDTNEPKLPASGDLDALIRKFAPRVPALTQAPLQFFADGLRRQLDISEQEGGQTDIYDLRGVIIRIEQAGKLLEDSERQATPDPLQPMRDAMTRADYPAAITAAGKLDIQALSLEDLRQAAAMLRDAGTSVGDSSEDKVAAYDLVAKIDIVLGDLPALVQAAKALVNKGFALGKLGRHEEAIAAYREALGRFGDSSEPFLRGQAARALVNIGATLGILGRNKEAVAAYDEADRRFGGSPEPTISEQIARALVNKGADLRYLGENEEAIATYDEVLRRFGDLSRPLIVEQVAMALVSKGRALGVLGRDEEAIAACDEVVSRFGRLPMLAHPEAVAWALVNKGYNLEKLGRREEELDVYDQFIERFGNSPYPTLLVPRAVALLGRAITLRNLDRDEESIEVFDDVIRRFGESAKPALRERVALALVNKAFALEKLGHSEEQIAAYSDALGRFGGSLEPALQRQVVTALLYRGLAFDSQGDREKAQADYNEVIARFESNPSPAIADIVKRAKDRLK